MSAKSNSVPAPMTAEQRLAEYRRIAREAKAAKRGPAPQASGLSMSERVGLAAASVPSFFEDVAAVYTAARLARQ